MPSVSHFMTRDPHTLAPTDTVAAAAQAMAKLNVGSIPVCDNGRLVGIVTDRDIVTRCVARGHDPKSSQLSDAMSPTPRSATESQDVDETLRAMAYMQIRRMPVVDASGKLVGIVSLGDIASKDPKDASGVARSLGAISAPAPGAAK